MDMPNIVRLYFDAASRNDADALSNTFADDAVVEDERARHEGRAAIHRWWIAAKQASDFVTQPLEALGINDTVQVRALVSGSFPGSPVTLTHSFAVKDGKIVRLGIR